MKKQLFTVLITALTIVFVVSCKDVIYQVRRQLKEF